jgi:predicted nucleic acid-binding protein
MSSTVTYLLDTSAAVRWMSGQATDEWREVVATGQVGMCDLTELEFLYSARSTRERAHVLAVLETTFPWVPIPDRIYGRAREVQGHLTERGWHRSAGTVDLLLAAVAELSGLILLHEDRDFETIAGVTGQETRRLLMSG